MEPDCKRKRGSRDMSSKSRISSSHRKGGQKKRFPRKDLGSSSLEIIKILLDNKLDNKNLRRGFEQPS